MIQIAFKNKNDLTFGAYDNVDDSSLKAFIDNCCIITEFEQDKISFDAFMAEYDLFCRMHSLEKVLIDYTVLQRKFGIESRRFSKKMVERDEDYSANLNKPNNHKNPCLKFINRFCNIFTQKKYYKFNIKAIHNLNTFLSGNMTTKDTPVFEIFKIV